MHLYSKSCGKCKNERCYCHFRKNFNDSNIIILPFQEDLPEDLENGILNEWERILKTNKQYTGNNLDLRKKYILNPFKENFEKVTSIKNIFMELNVKEEEYYNVLSILCDSDVQIHIKR